MYWVMFVVAIVVFMTEVVFAGITLLLSILTQAACSVTQTLYRWLLAVCEKGKSYR